MSYPVFQEKELNVVGVVHGFRSDAPLFDFPITPRENSKAAHMHKTPAWCLTDLENRVFSPSVIPDHIARGFIFEEGSFPRERYGGKDMFGVEWQYIEVVHGSMVRPGSPLLKDANDWREKIVFPEIDAWDWEGSGDKNREYLNSDFCTAMTLLNGCWFERLISFMDFEGAAFALIDEDQHDALKELLHETTSLYMRIVDKCVQYYNIDGFSIHDDWGSQMAPFFSERVARDLFLPEMKRFVEHVHSKGLYCDLHSCGHVEDRCNIFVEAGFDSWSPMAMNNTSALYEKYGDRMLIQVVTDNSFDAATASEEEQRAAARDFVTRFVKPGKFAAFAPFYNKEGMLTPAFREELFKASRLALQEDRT